MKYTPLLPDIVVASSLLRSLLGLPALQLQLLATGSKLRQLRNRGTQGTFALNLTAMFFKM
jgi:hypothetical protein